MQKEHAGFIKDDVIFVGWDMGRLAMSSPLFQGGL